MITNIYSQGVVALIIDESNAIEINIMPFLVSQPTQHLLHPLNFQDN